MTVGTVAFLTVNQPPTYQSQSTYIVKVSAAGSDVLAALGLVSRQTEIAETYAQAAQSRTMREGAVRTLGLDARQQADVKLASQLVPGSNVLQLTVTSRDPNLAKDYCDAVGAALVKYADGLYPSFELVTLDPASRPERPISPNIPLNLAMGLGGGLALAIAVGIGAGIIAPRPGPTPQMEILDEESPAYSNDFFAFRLQQEMSRTRRTGAPLCVALVNVNHFSVLDRADVLVRRDAIRRVAGILGGRLRPEDMSARLEGDRFALLLCDINERDAQRMVEALRVLVNSLVVGKDQTGEPLRALAAAGLVEYAGEAVTADEILSRAGRALERAESVPAGSTQPFSGLSQGWSPASREFTRAPADME